jgi:hypothetical protein
VQEAFRLTNNCQVVQGARAEPSDLSDVHDPQTEGSSISSDEVSAALSAHRGCGHLSANLPLPQLPDEDPSTVIPQSQLLSLQEQDQTISRVLFYVQRKRKATRREAAAEPACVSKLLRHWKKLKVQNGILYRVRKDNRLNKKLSQFIVPDGLKHDILLGLHDNAGHQGRARTLSLARERFFWAGMETDIVNHVRRCERCIVGKTLEPAARAPLESIHTSEPMELVCIDFWTAELSEKKLLMSWS